MINQVESGRDFGLLLPGVVGVTIGLSSGTIGPVLFCVSLVGRGVGSGSGVGVGGSGIVELSVL